MRFLDLCDATFTIASVQNLV